MRVAVYPGSFDPITFGHLDVARRAAAVFDRVVFAVLTNPRKHSLLTVAERLEAIRASVAATDPALVERIDAQSFDGLTVPTRRRVYPRRRSNRRREHPLLVWIDVPRVTVQR